VTDLGGASLGELEAAVSACEGDGLSDHPPEHCDVGARAGNTFLVVPGSVPLEGTALQGRLSRVESVWPHLSTEDPPSGASSLLGFLRGLRLDVYEVMR
jgi:hypothetical protein